MNIILKKNEIVFLAQAEGEECEGKQVKFELYYEKPDDTRTFYYGVLTGEVINGIARAPWTFNLTNARGYRNAKDRAKTYKFYFIASLQNNYDQKHQVRFTEPKPELKQYNFQSIPPCLKQRS